MTLAINITDGRGLSNKAHRIICCVSHSFHSKEHLTSFVLLRRWSASVLKVGVPCGWVVKLSKENWPLVSQ